MQNGKKKVLALLLAGCCVLSACGTKTDDTKTAEKGNFVTGTVECKEVYVRAKIPGYLTDIPVEEGQEVKEGDLLFSTDRRDVEVKQTQASATAKAAAGQVEAAKNAAEAAAAVVEKANANVKLLETEYAKYQELYAMDAVSQDNMDKLTTQLEAARLDAAAAAAQQQAAQGQYEAANGQLAAAKGVLDEVNLNLGQTSQYAPCNGTITSYFGRRNTGIKGASTYHEAIDIANSYGTPIYASDGGTVIYSGWQGGYGYLVKIDHGNGYVTYYGHNSSLLVSVGEHVHKGQQVARMGSTGVSSGNHCDFRIQLNGTFLNPLNYL